MSLLLDLGSPEACDNLTLPIVLFSTLAKSQSQMPKVHQGKAARINIGSPKTSGFSLMFSSFGQGLDVSSCGMFKAHCVVRTNNMQSQGQYTSCDACSTAGNDRLVKTEALVFEGFHQSVFALVPGKIGLMSLKSSQTQ